MVEKKLKKLSMNRLWRIWCRTMGDKISTNQKEADVAAIIRTLFWIINLITCGFIIANAIHHW